MKNLIYVVIAILMVACGSNVTIGSCYVAIKRYGNVQFDSFHVINI